MAKARKEFTEETARGLTKPGLHADPQSTHLYVRVGKTASTYTVLVRAGGKQRWISIGRVGVDGITLDEARALARTTVAAAKAGPPPAAPKAPKTFAQVFEEWSAAVGRTQIRWRDKERRIKRNLIPEFGHRPFAEIERTDVVDLLDKIVAEGHARLADMVKIDVVALEKFYAERTKGYTTKFRGYISKRSTAKSRKRVLSEVELRSLWIAAGNGPTDSDWKFGAVVKLLVLCGQRREKVIAMKWRDVDLERETWKVPRGEESNEKGVPLAPLRLPPLAIELIRAQEIEVDGRRHRLSEFVFPAARGGGCIRGLSGFKHDLESRMSPLKADEVPWVTHDLRRTCRTLMSKAKATITLKDGHLKDIRIDRDVAEAILGHVIPGVQGVYDRPDLEQEMGEALALLADHVAKIVGENIVSLVQAS